MRTVAQLKPTPPRTIGSQRPGGHRCEMGTCSSFTFKKSEEKSACFVRLPQEKRSRSRAISLLLGIGIPPKIGLHPSFSDPSYPSTTVPTLLKEDQVEKPSRRGFGFSNSIVTPSSQFCGTKKPQNSYLALRFSRTNLFLVMASAGSSETLRFTLTMGVGWRSASR